ncbi:ABC transporter substrate-binding protein [Planobispora takensis]|uniref:ABC transporter substrate-binding protein n=1 Tax=Planobispora takensis TaxID=1367882 RepID=A0A8J3T4Y1_9ACTN|nr:extracellular solute-binding protein [Planobispora takensis]GII04170.1 ABC transporter substrate-binding protein [Planobispora takensis]
MTSDDRVPPGPGHRLPARRAAITGHAALLLTGVLLSGACGSQESAGSRVTLEFFQFKPEAIETFDRIIADFEAAHPGIDVVQNHSPTAESAIRARLVKDDVPDVISLNGNGVFGELASAGVFHDFSAAPAAKSVNPPIQRILDDLGVHRPGEINGLPFASNVSGVIYNKDLFRRHGVEPPATWTELVAAAKRFQAAGVTPFYLTLKDSWTALPAFNALAANLAPQDFFDAREAGRTSFASAYPQVVGKLSELFGYGQRDRFSRDYDDGNQAFAQGKAAMYLQGSFAIPAIDQFEPDFEIGTFALPATDDASATRLVSGVDVALTMPREPEHPKEAMAFIDYLMRPEVTRAYADEQRAVPPTEDAASQDPVLAGLMPYFSQGRLTGYADHHIPLTIQLDAHVQQFLIDGDRERLLRTLDDEWDKVAARRS